MSLLAVSSSLANVGPPFDADFDFVRNEVGFGQSHGRLLLRSFYFAAFRSGPPPLPALGRPSRAVRALALSVSKRDLSVFNVPAAVAPSLVNAVLLSAGSVVWGFDRKGGELYRFF